MAERASAWAAAEGWNPGVDDAERFVRADPQAFMATERNGEIAGTVSCAHYGERYAFIGFFIVAERRRGDGLGSDLFDRAIAHAGGRAIGLDGVLAQQGYYERRGFELAHRNVRWRTVGGGLRPPGLIDVAGAQPDSRTARPGNPSARTRGSDSGAEPFCGPAPAARPRCPRAAAAAATRAPAPPPASPRAPAAARG